MSMLQKIFQFLFIWDWKIVWSDFGKWKVKNITDWGNYTSKESCTYEIYYSKTLNSYRLKCYGYKPKCHPKYKYAVEVFNNYITK